MAKSLRGWYWHLCSASLLAMGGALADSENYAFAQIVPDTTLGGESSVVTPNAGNVDVIERGATRGANLFHSFEQFSVPTGGTAFFNNALDIQNIISRVTGSSVSKIDGLIRANGTANLFLLNANGIIFGPNASLDIGGSFVGSTASRLNFADGTQFSASTPQTTPLLTISVPIGLQYGGTAGSILNQSRATDNSGEVVGLQVQPGRTLALLGGDVSLDGGNLQAPGGRVELGGLAAAGTVGLNFTGNNLSLNFPEGVARADVFLTNGAGVNVRAGGGGSIVINAQNLNLAGGSSLRAGIDSGLGSVGSQAGDIEINATGSINLTDDSIIANGVLPEAVGKGGNIDITAGSLSGTNGVQLLAVTYGQGDAGSVNINARDTVTFDSVSGAGSIVQAGAVGNGGDINLTSGSLSLTNTAQLAAGTRGQGNAGSVNINVRDTVSFDGGLSGAYSNVDSSYAVGNSGGINLTTGSLSLTNGAQLVTATRGQGNAGSVNINVRDTVSFDGESSDAFSFKSSVGSTVESNAVGNGGDINITAGSLSLTNAAQLAAGTRGQGNAGSVNINVRDTVSFDGKSSDGFSSGAFSTVEPGAVGNGSNIKITASSLFVMNGAVLSADTRGQGDGGNIRLNANFLEAVNGGQVLSTSRSSGKAGNITLNVTKSVTLAGSDRTYNARLAQFGEDVVIGASPASGLFASTSETSTAGGGKLRITTEQLTVRDGAEVRVSSQGSGDAGNLEATVRSIRLDNQAALNAETTAGQGNITLHSQNVVLRRGSNITTNATGKAEGGNITIDSDVLAALENSDISANAQNARGGRIRIDAQGIFGTEFRERENPASSDITATSDLGPQFSGTVEINTPDVDLSSGLATLPAELVDVSGLIAQGCPGSRGNVGRGVSEFIITGRGGLPPSPSEALRSDAVRVDLGTPIQSEENRASATVSTNLTSSEPTPIVEAQGWVINNMGEVVLTATAPTATPHNPWMTPATCHAPKPSS